MIRRLSSAFVFAIVGTSLLLPSTSGAQGERNPSPYQTRSQSIEGVRSVKVEGPFQVLVMSGAAESSVRLSGPPELLADATARMEGGTLTIALREGAQWSWNPGSGMHAVVHLPALESLEVEGAAIVEAIGVSTPVSTFAGSVSGAGRMHLAGLNARTVRLAVGGSGLIDVEGTAADVTYALGGAGTIDAKRLRAQTGVIALGGAGSIFADVSGPAQINVDGSGRVEVVGGAACTTRAPRASQVECR